MWEEEKSRFERGQSERNARIDQLRERYPSRDPEAVCTYSDVVLTRSDHSGAFPKKFDLEYRPETRILVVDYSLPAPTAVPTLKEVKYIKSRGEDQEKHVAEREQNRLYDALLYQICLRTIYELYDADEIEALDAVVFNGFVESVDPATGQDVNACVLSVQATRGEFLQLNLSLVDPKACFRGLKGVGSSKLHSITPVTPVLRIEREDKRFVDSYDVADGLDEADNLAVMDWQDFEHLICELFEAEFSHDGGEVRVTQASRDGGVDAVAFDPDPIRGGKMVIQAKRYASTVRVAAVRELWGTVMNEGAMKGILVTTSDYGPDAHEFAKGKPIRLVGGGELLGMLERHGHRARIDLREARRLAAE